MYPTARRAERPLETERDQCVRLTAAVGLSRVARATRDIVGLNLSVMVGLADSAAALAAHRNDRSAGALRALGDSGRQAMVELRRVLGVLREERESDLLPAGPGAIALVTAGVVRPR